MSIIKDLPINTQLIRHDVQIPLKAYKYLKYELIHDKSKELVQITDLKKFFDEIGVKEQLLVYVDLYYRRFGFFNGDYLTVFHFASNGLTPANINVLVQECSISEISYDPSEKSIILNLNSADREAYSAANSNLFSSYALTEDNSNLITKLIFFNILDFPDNATETCRPVRVQDRIAPVLTFEYPLDPWYQDFFCYVSENLASSGLNKEDFLYNGEINQDDSLSCTLTSNNENLQIQFDGLIQKNFGFSAAEPLDLTPLDLIDYLELIYDGALISIQGLSRGMAYSVVKMFGDQSSFVFLRIINHPLEKSTVLEMGFENSQSESQIDLKMISIGYSPNGPNENSPSIQKDFDGTSITFFVNENENGVIQYSIKSSSKFKTWQIILIVSGAVLAIVTTIIIICLCCRRIKKTERSSGVVVPSENIEPPEEQIPIGTDYVMIPENYQ